MSSSSGNPSSAIISLEFDRSAIIARFSSPVESPICVDAFSGQYTNALDRAARGGAPCSASCIGWPDRSEKLVRPVAVQNDDDPTNAHPEGTLSGQARVGLP